MQFRIIGAGWIGKYLSETVLGTTLEKGRFETVESIQKLLSKMGREEILVNCAGRVGKPNVDWCEDHQEETLEGNLLLPAMIAHACHREKRYWIHVGSGCVYNGYGHAYTEEDRPNYMGSFYSATHVLNQAMLSYFPEACVIRIRMPIDEALSAKCYAGKVYAYGKTGMPMMTTKNSVTMLPLLADALHFIATRRATGVFNVVNQGTVSPTDILSLYKEYIDPDLEWIEASVEEVEKNLKAQRSNCVLSMRKLEKMGFTAPHILEVLGELFKAKKEEPVLMPKKKAKTTKSKTSKSQSKTKKGKKS